jgi:hypothetical protein
VIEARVVRAGPDDFAVRVLGRGRTAGEVVRSLVELARLQAPPPDEVRVHRRVVPTHRTVRVALADGTSVPARILNLSASGVALQLGTSLKVGQVIAVGRHKARVAREIDGGVGAAFLKPLKEASVGVHTVL